MFVLMLALGVMMLVGRVSLVHAECAAHKSQAALEKATPAKEMATYPQTDQTVTDQTRTAKVDKPATPAPEVKK
jgi:hypothetical protein